MLVIGGTGMLGAPLARRLVEDSHEVRVMSRSATHQGVWDRGIEYVPGDLADVRSLRSAMEGCGAVHVSVRGGPSAERSDRIEHHGPALAAEQARMRGVSRLTFVSHMLAGATADAPDLAAKGRAEQAIVASGVPYTIFRPTYFMETLSRQLRGRRAVVLGRQRHPLQMLAAGDFARMVLRALTTRWPAPA